MKEKDLIRFMDRMIEERKAEYALGTAHIYQASRNALSAFLKAHDIPFKRVRPELLKQFERFLRRRGNSWNTVSTYMRVLRAVYNRAVDRRLAPHVPHLFKAVYTGTQADIKRALKAEAIGTIAENSSPVRADVSFKGASFCRLGLYTKEGPEWEYPDLSSQENRTSDHHYSY